MRFQSSLAALFASTAMGIALPPPLSPLSPPSPLGGLTPLTPLTPLATPPPAATPNAGGPLPQITGVPSPSTPDASFPTLNLALENPADGVFPAAGPSGTGTGTGFPMPPPPTPTGGPMLRRRSKPVRRAV